MKRGMFVFGVALAASLLAGCSTGKTQETSVETTAEASVETTADGVGEVPAAVLDIATTQSFTEEAVSAEDVETILLAGLNAPSAMNGQPWHFSVVTDNAVLQQIADGMSAGMPPRTGDAANLGMPGTPPAGDAANPSTPPPAGDGENAERPAVPPAGGGAKAGIADAPLAIVISCKDGSELDAGLACQNMSVAAVLLGYGTKIVTSPTIALNGANQEQYRELLGIPEGYAAAAVLLVGHAAEAEDAATSATVRNSMEEMVSWIAP